MSERPQHPGGGAGTGRKGVGWLCLRGVLSDVDSSEPVCRINSIHPRCGVGFLAVGMPGSASLSSLRRSSSGCILLLPPPLLACEGGGQPPVSLLRFRRGIYEDAGGSAESELAAMMDADFVCQGLAAH